MSTETTTVPAGSTSSPEKPNLYALLDEAASGLLESPDAAARVITLGLADYVLGALIGPSVESGDEAESDAVIEGAIALLVRDRMRDFIKVEYLLDETPAAVAALDAMSATLLTAIGAQDHQYFVLRELVSRDITIRAKGARCFPRPSSAAVPGDL